MIYRILLYLRKLKILNILLVLFISVSIVGISISAFNLYKNSKAIDEFNKIDNFTIVSNNDYSSDSVYFNSDSNEIFETFKKVYNDSRVTDIKYSFFSSINAKEFGFEYFKEEEEIYTFITHDISEFKQYMNLEDSYELDENKVYISSEIFEYYNLKSGDVLTLSTIDYSSVFSVDEEPDYIDLVTVTIDDVIESEFEDEDTSKEQSYVVEGKGGDDSWTEPIYAPYYIPISVILELDSSTYDLYDMEFTFTASDKDLQDITSEIESDNYYVYNSKNVLQEELEFFNDMTLFFLYLLVVSVVLLVVTFVALNNNVNERRRQEIQLYNIFGQSFKSVRVQLVIEKLVLLVISLVFAIPAALFAFRKTTNIINTIVEYSFNFDSKISQLLSMYTYMFGKYSELNADVNNVDFYYIYTSLDISKGTVIAISIIFTTLTLCLITFVQATLNKKRFVEQRRDL